MSKVKKKPFFSILKLLLCTVRIRIIYETNCGWCKYHIFSQRMIKSTNAASKYHSRLCALKIHKFSAPSPQFNFVQFYHVCIPLTRFLCHIRRCKWDSNSWALSKLKMLTLQCEFVSFTYCTRIYAGSPFQNG